MRIKGVREWESSSCVEGTVSSVMKIWLELSHKSLFIWININLYIVALCFKSAVLFYLNGFICIK